MPQHHSHANDEIIGLVPAGGRAKRIAPLPCSKELYPVGFSPGADGRGLRPKVVAHYLLEKMRLAGVTKAYIVLREGKWDIPNYFGDGFILNMDLAYLMMRLPWGTPYTLDQAYPFVKKTLVAFGFPDILFQPEDAFVQLCSRWKITNADAVLGLFVANQRDQVDMVDVDEAGRVRQIVRKPLQTHLHYTWNIALWTPAFTHFMHEHLASVRDEDGINDNQETVVGDVIQAAIGHNLRVEAVTFSQGHYLDIGTPDDLVKATRQIG